MRIEAVAEVAKVYVIEPSERKAIVYIRPACDVVVELGEDRKRMKQGDELKIVVRRRNTGEIY